MNNNQEKWTIPLLIAGIPLLLYGLVEIINDILSIFSVTILNDVSQISSSAVVQFCIGLAFVTMAFKLNKRKNITDKNESQEMVKNNNEGKEVSLSEIKDLITSSNKKIEAIENRQIRNAWQWLFSLGVSAMAVGISWLLATTSLQQGDYKSGLFVFIAGLLITILALCSSNRKKSS